MKKGIYLLANLERRLCFPFRLYQIGWMPKHVCSHRNKVIRDLFFCFSFNKDEGGISEVNGKIRIGRRDASFSMLTPGTVLTTVKGQLHDELFFVYQSECTELFQKMFGCDSFSFDGVCPDGPQRDLIGQIRRHLDNLHEECAADMLDSLAFSFVTRMFLQRSARHTVPCMNNIRMEDIGVELTQGKSLDRIIRKYGFSRRSFYREWHRFCPDRTPTEYRQKYQLTRAETLLMQSNLPVSEIVNMCGFSSNINFCRLFRKKYGCSATEYRSRRSGGELAEF